MNKLYFFTISVLLIFLFSQCGFFNSQHYKRFQKKRPTIDKSNYQLNKTFHDCNPVLIIPSLTIAKDISKEQLQDTIIQIIKDLIGENYKTAYDKVLIDELNESYPNKVWYDTNEMATAKFINKKNDYKNGRVSYLNFEPTHLNQVIYSSLLGARLKITENHFINISIEHCTDTVNKFKSGYYHHIFEFNREQYSVDQIRMMKAEVKGSLTIKIEDNFIQWKPFDILNDYYYVSIPTDLDLYFWKSGNSATNTSINIDRKLYLKPKNYNSFYDNVLSIRNIE